VNIFGSIGRLSSQQAPSAEVVVSTAMADAAEDPLAARIALMVAHTESGVRDLGPMARNAGSLGLFQQRASEGWGTASQELDPAQATVMFVSRLAQVPGWYSRPPWVVAQAVQRSAIGDGSNYRANWSLAGSLLGAVLANGNAVGGCRQGPPDGVAGEPSPDGLLTGYVIPAGTLPGPAAAVAFALAWLSDPYLWGGAGPVAYDCSGLTEKAWAVAGVPQLLCADDQLYEGDPVAAPPRGAGGSGSNPRVQSTRPGTARPCRHLCGGCVTDHPPPARVFGPIIGISGGSPGGRGGSCADGGGWIDGQAGPGTGRRSCPGKRSGNKTAPIALSARPGRSVAVAMAQWWRDDYLSAGSGWGGCYA
jgi:cell wall-associated NlpC family hydrolase